MKKTRLLVFAMIAILVICNANIWAGGEAESTQAAEEEQVTLEVWIQASHSPEAANETVASAFQNSFNSFYEQNPNVKINISTFGPLDVLREKTFASASAGVRPDVVQMKADWLPALSEMGWVQPLNDLVPEDILSDFVKVNLEAEMVDGTLYALPFFAAVRTFYYRKSHLDEVGEEPPKTWEDVYRIGKKQRDAGRWGIAFPGKPGGYSFPYVVEMMNGFGGELVDEDGNPIFFEGKNREALKKVYGYQNSLVHEYEIAPKDVVNFDDRGIFPNIFADEVSMWMSVSGMMGHYANSRPDILADLGSSLVPMPEGNTPSAIISPWSYSLISEDPAKTDAAIKLMLHLTRPEHLEQYVPGYYSMLTRKSAEIPDALDSDIYRSFQNQVATQGRILPRVPYFPQLAESLSRGIGDVILGERTSDQVIENAKEIILEEIESRE